MPTGNPTKTRILRKRRRLRKNHIHKPLQRKPNTLTAYILKWVQQLLRNN